MEEKDYLDALVDKMEAVGMANENYVNQLSRRLEPILEEPEGSKFFQSKPEAAE